MVGRGSKPERHRRGALRIDEETAGWLGADGRVLLGTFGEAELDAVGVPGSIGRPETAVTSSPLDRAGPSARQTAVAAALAQLTAGGAVEPARPGTAPGRLVVHGPLGLLRDALAGYRAALLVMASDLTYGYDAVMRVDRAVGVVGPRDRPLLLDQRLDTVSGRTDVVLWTPEAYAAAMAQEAFTDPAGEPPDEPGFALSLFAVRATWSVAGGTQAMVLRLKRREGADTGVLQTTVGDEEMPSGTGNRQQIEQVLVNLLHRMLAA